MAHPQPVSAARPNGAAAFPTFADLYAEHHDYVVRVCKSLLRNPDDVLDAVQDTFVAALQHPELLREARSVRRLLSEIAANRSRDLLRRRRVRTAHSLDGMIDLGQVPAAAGEPFAEAEAAIDADDLHSALRASIDHLHEGVRPVAQLRYLEGYTYRAIATQLQLALGTVKSRLRRIHDRLRTDPVVGRMVRHYRLAQ